MTAPVVQPGNMAAYGALPVPHVTPEMLRLVKTGRVYSLSVVYAQGMPAPEPMVSYTIAPHMRHGDLAALTPASAAAEVMTMSAHVGTHIDALCHIGERQDAAGSVSPDGEIRLFAGAGATVRAADHADQNGQKHLSIAEMPPIVTRAVLVDVAGSLGVDVLPDAYNISADEIRAALEKQGTTITPGTVVLVRTGFYKHLASGSLAYRDAIAGIGLEAAQWLHQQGMVLAGADNMTVEAVPPMDHRVHRYLLTHHGVTHLENLYLEELAANRVYEFLLIVTPLRLQGATGSWVHPIAIA
ncbi:MAG: cyclase family protein [Anaerolineae bacterium]|nr:cyclase family protein [Anaerolineae bacterium]